MSDPIRIYVACLASYNSGTLHGEWIDATLGVDHIWEEVRKMLRASPYPNVMVDCPNHRDADPANCPTCNGTGKVPSAEEWAIHDCDGFYGIKLGEWESFEKVAELAALLEEHGPAYAAYADNVGAEYATAEGFQDAYQGEYDSVEDYAREYIDSTGMLSKMPDSLQHYFDYKTFARDLELGGDIHAIKSPDHRVYIFNNT